MEGGVIVVEEFDKERFETACDTLILEGYTISSSACHLVQVADYEYESVWQAIFIHKGDM